MMKLKVALVRGPILSTRNAINNEATPCIAFAYISAYLKKKGYSVTVIDGIGEGLNQIWYPPEFPGYQCQGLTLEKIVARIPGDTDVVGFSAMFSGEWPLLRALVERVRKQIPKALLVAGGEHATALSEYTLRDCPALDACVLGEGERTFFELLEAYRTGQSVDQVNGVALIDSSGNYRFGAAAPRIRDVDAIPWPDWKQGYLEKFWNAGKSYGVGTARDMPFMASRGCPYQCTFCSNPLMWTTRYILRDVDDVIAEIKSYIKRYDITALQFYDLTAITKKRWTVEFCTKLISEGIKLQWSLPSGTRSEALDEETLGLLKETGCNYLVYAPESGSQRTLERIKKRIDLKRVTASIETAKRLGITLRANLIIAFPHETRADVFATLFYGLRLAFKGVDEVSINIFSPYPGTELFDELAADGKIEINDEYFLRLTSLNSDYSTISAYTFSNVMSPQELGLYRILFMLINYVTGYVVFPSRIIRTIRNVFLSDETRANTVFEHRLRDALRRKSPDRAGA